MGDIFFNSTLSNHLAAQHVTQFKSDVQFMSHCSGITSNLQAGRWTHRTENVAAGYTRQQIQVHILKKNNHKAHPFKGEFPISRPKQSRGGEVDPPPSVCVSPPGDHPPPSVCVSPAGNHPPPLRLCFASVSPPPPFVFGSVLGPLGVSTLYVCSTCSLV